MNNILDDVEFENEIRVMSDRQLSEFTARQIKDICKTCKIHGAKIKALEAINSRMILFGSVIGVGSVGATEGVIRLWKVLMGA